MIKDKQIQIIETVFKNFQKQKNKTDADGITHIIDAGRYTSLERFEREKELIIKSHPIVVGATGQLQSNGDYFLHDLTGTPILIVKGKDGVVRAFLNMCRHRGVRLLEESEGKIKRNIVCPYHAWAYDTTGCLKAVFHEQGFDGVNAETHSLIELDCWVRLGMLFVVPNPELKGKFDIDDWLSEVYSITEDFEFGDLYPYHFTSETLDCNWKLVVDGALEGYHFKIAHANTIGKYFLDNLSLNMENKLHSTIVFPKRALEKMKELPETEWRLRQGANILIHIFPNTVILIEPDHIMVVSFVPIDEKTTQFYSFMLLPTEPQSQKDKDYWDLNAKIFWNAISEDNEMAVLQQKSFNGYSDTEMVVGSYEKLLVQFEILVDEMISP
ncbi:aromatic ring-hydroxylating oxygenase subunit alpha [Croceivirga thetidis]|uniref:Rieske 2Fe-2S domain-containing protein n=1 Tax=Croceivirga thetidis TaxID=2721623 RepID=A0ABX1GSM0_9FLAO|nr:SRPBCC family protein [Croceivirga thetidis]NKI32942.1 Rieske 2Fe-2S domain-containing protein [Croceivirga thetidis]